MTRIVQSLYSVSSGLTVKDDSLSAMSDHHHGHDHDHAHEHDDRPGPHGAPLTDVQLRVRALESLLVDKGLVDPKALDTLIDTYETKVGPRNGARVVAKAWVDPAFKQRLLADSTAAIAELGYIGRQGEDMVVLENTPKSHNVVVCTLCSCYPWPVLGLPPVWYKSGPYRARTVIDPRSVLREFGVDLADDVEVRVWDSTAELRYLVLPERPVGTEGMTEEHLATTYYEHWLYGLERLLVEKGLVTANELATMRQNGRAQGLKAIAVEDVPMMLRNRRAARMGDRLAPPRFKAGDRVRTKNLHPT